MAQPQARAPSPRRVTLRRLSHGIPQRAGADVWASLGANLGLAGKVDQAVQAMTRAVELEPENPRLMAKLAFAEHAAGRKEAAVAHLTRTAQLSPGGSFAHSGALGILLFQQGRRDEARNWLRGSRPGERDFAEPRFTLAILEAEAGAPAAARRALQEALTAAPGLRARAKADRRLAALL